MSGYILTICGATSSNCTLFSSSLNVISDLFIDFNVDFRLELPHIDKICDGEVHVVEEIVECTDKMQILCQFPVKPLVPVGRWTVHTDERVKTFVDVRR